MIVIEEKEPKKLPGLSSLFITFDYNAEIVSIVKQSGNAIYYKKEQMWEVPVTSLADLLDSLCKVDDIKLKLLKNKKEKLDDIQFLTKFKTKPFEYQLDGIKFGLQHQKWMLLDVPGLGKTLQTIYIAQELKKRDNIEHCLVICGINTLKSNWKSEIQKHSNLSCRILGEYETKNGSIKIGGVKERLNQLKSKIKEFFVITNIETLRNDDVVKEIEKGKNKFDLILFDEVHCAKSPSSQQGSNLLKLKSAKYKIAMTGTLLLNSPLDCYVPLKWLGLDNSTYTNFKYYYCNFGGPFGNIPMGYKHLDVLKDQIEKYSLRRTKDLLDLPEKTIINEYVDMNDSQKSFYDNVVSGVVSQVDKVKMSTANLLSMVCRLRQATAFPPILTSEHIDSSKIERCLELVEQILSNGSKVVIFSTFKDSANYLHSILKNSLLCTGDIKDDVIKSNIEKFQNDEKYKVLIATWQKMGTGITLTAANYAIFLDTPWTEGVYEQAQDRIHRIGSKKPVFIYNLVCKDTIDERVLKIVNTKGALSNYVVDDDTSDEVINSLREYIEELQ